MAGRDQTTAAPPYGVFATFVNSIKQLSEAMPNQIDRTVFPGTAWTAQSQLLAGLRTLGLIDDLGRPTQRLRELAVPDEAQRKKELERLVRTHYARIFELNLLKTTPAELDQRMTDVYEIGGDTRKKAIRFFLSALEYLGIQFSPLFSKPRRRKRSNGNGASRRRRSRSRQAENSTVQSDQATSGTSRSIKLSSGGTLALSVELDVLRLDPADRKFVFELIDKLDEYEQNRGTDQPPTEE